jgi:hypothetical protein
MSSPFLQMQPALKPGSVQVKSAWHFPIAYPERVRVIAILLQVPDG